MGQDYRKIARWEVLAGVRVPVDEDGNYLNQDDVRGEEAREVTSPYGSLNFAVGYGEEGDDGGDWFACFDYHVLPDGRVVLDSAQNSESGAYIEDFGYQVVSAGEAPRAALEMVEQALEIIAAHEREHDVEGWNQDPYYFVRAVAKACRVPHYAKMTDKRLRRGRVPTVLEAKRKDATP